jgi:hypothetical protein
LKKIPFGDYLYEFHCDPKLTESALDYLLNSEIYWTNTVPDRVESNDAGYMDENKLVPYYHEELFNWIQECIDEVVADELPQAKLAICDSWVTRSKFGQARIHPHHHINSVLSGIFYFTSHPKTNTIFYKNKPLALMMEKMFCHVNDVEFRRQFYKVKEQFSSESIAGKLIIFHSNIDHSISVNKDLAKTRYTLAFNTYPTGEIYPSVSSGRLEMNIKTSKERYLEYTSKKEQ